MNDRNVRVVFEFGGFRADPLTRRLSSGDRALPITPKAFETLLVLLQNRGEVVAKGELMDAVWADTAVEENNLTQQVATLRRTLGDRSRDHRFIITVPGKGYSFVAPVGEIEIRDDETFVLAEASRSTVTIDVSTSGWPSLSAFFARSGVLGASLAAAYVILVCALAVWPMLIGGGPLQTVAVLDFRSSAFDDAELTAGIRDTLRARLGNLEDVAVRPSRIGVPSDDALIAGRALNADVVLTGSVQHQDGRVRVAVELVDVRRARVVWGQTFDRSRGELFELQDAIAGEAVRALTSSRL